MPVSPEYAALKSGNKTAPSGPGKTYADIAMDELLRLTQDQGGQLLSAGRPGYTVSRAGARNAASSRYSQNEANRAALYNEAVGEVTGRSKGISSAYENAGESILADARARVMTDMQNAGQRDSDRAQAASALGLGIVPSTGDRADTVMQANAGKYTQNAQSWNGFLRAAGKTAVERNEAVGDSFRHEGAQQQLALQRMLESVLSGLGDSYVGPTAAKYSKPALSGKDKASAYRDLLDNFRSDQKLDLDARKA